MTRKLVKNLIVTAFLAASSFHAGCALFSYEIIPQTVKGPNGGQVVFVNQSNPEYIEWVATPKEEAEPELMMKQFRYRFEFEYPSKMR